jgi:hypothetical protein
MTPERMARLVARWVRRYTRGLPAPVAERRAGELEADVHDHIAHARAQGTSDGRIAFELLSRMIRGLPADAEWRGDHAGRHPTARAARSARRRAYGGGSLVGLGAAFILFFGAMALGVVGEEGDPADRMYLGVLGIGLVLALVGRFRPEGLARALLAMALAQGVCTLIALAMGKQNDPVTSLHELIGLNGFFATLFVISALLFRRAARQRHDPAAGA